MLERSWQQPFELALMESTTRRFDGLLAEFLTLRDGGMCRTPGCNATIKNDATIRNLDHVTTAADAGRTAATNGQGLCERCNYVRESPAWISWVPDAGPTRPDARHEVHGVTEHLRILRSTAPPLPGGPVGGPDHSPTSSASPAASP